jgi:signal transduction histidine kinase
MFKKLRNKMMLFNMLTVLLVMTVAFAAIYIVTCVNIDRYDEQRLREVSMMFFAPNRVPQGDAPGNFEPPVGPERFSVEYGVSFVLFVRNGRLESVNSQLDLEDAVYAEAFEKIGNADGGEITLADRKWRYAAVPAPPQSDGSSSMRPADLQYTRIVFLDVTNSARILWALLLTLVCVGLGVLAALLWFSYLFAVRAVRPIEESYDRQKRFVADASHELRTPLAIVGANVDAITASAGESVGSQREWFGYIRAELARMGKIVNDLLYLAKSEELQYESNVPFDLSLVCETVCASMEAGLYELGVSVEKHIEGDIIAVADSERIAQVLCILLDNAGKYTPHGGTVKVTLSRLDEWAALKVINTGDGISAVDLPRIFDRFYRADTSRSAESGSFGLGLSIAKTIVDRSDGTITAESQDGLTEFTVKLRFS